VEATINFVSEIVDENVLEEDVTLIEGINFVECRIGTWW
jgi:hypothetical protein